MANHQSIGAGMVKSDNYTTPKRAFLDVAAYKPQHLTVIHDPFYNDGKAAQYLAEAFPNCHIIHENQDAFAHSVPADIIITNPPFSIKDKVMKWLIEQDKPFMVLLPINHVCNKGFKKLHNFSEFQFVVPHGRYNFEIGGKASSSNWFNCLWYCYKCNLPRDINYILPSP